MVLFVLVCVLDRRAARANACSQGGREGGRENKRERERVRKKGNHNIRLTSCASSSCVH